MTDRSLARAFSKLNDEQREAVLHNDSTVVGAGPGSGKTQTLTVKIAHLVSERVLPPQGVACITFTREAAREFSGRLDNLGIPTGRYLFLGTVHGFCLQKILRPFACIAGQPWLADPEVLRPRAAQHRLRACLQAVGIPERPSEPLVQRIRRDVACGASLADYDPTYLEAIRQYESELRRDQVIDFDAIVTEALNLVTNVPRIRELLTAKYPWVAVDEYQDLGQPLHEIVLALHRSGTKVFAVGDVDQSLYGFTGARPEFLDQLASEGFHEVALRFNYRCGTSLIAASQAALGAPRDHQPDPDRADPGEVLLEYVPGGLTEQAGRIAAILIPQLLAAGVPAHEIAVIYRGQGPLVEAITDVLAAASIPFFLDRDDRLPRAEVVAWAQRCASWTLGERGSANTFRDLADQLKRWYRDACIDDRSAAADLYAALEQAAAPDGVLVDWLQRLDRAGVRQALCVPRRSSDEASVWSELLYSASAELQQMALQEFADGARPTGKVAVTNFHNAKGREFEAVILPGLQRGLIPHQTWRRSEGRFLPLNPQAVRDDRQLFYVGITRASRSVFLLWSDEHIDRWGNRVPSGPSPFIEEIRAALDR